MDSMWEKVGPAVHPADGEGGTVYRTPVGVDVLVCCGGSVRSLPRRWREQQPAKPSGLARCEQLFAPKGPFPGSIL